MSSFRLARFTVAAIERFSTAGRSAATRVHKADAARHEVEMASPTSAVWFAEQLRQSTADAAAPLKADVLFCTEMLNLAEFLGLCPKPIRHLPSVVYFHENQLSYPSRGNDDHDLHGLLEHHDSTSPPTPSGSTRSFIAASS